MGRWLPRCPLRICSPQKERGLKQAGALLCAQIQGPQVSPWGELEKAAFEKIKWDRSVYSVPLPVSE